VSVELDLRPGWVAGELEAEFPALGLVTTRVEARSGRSPREVRERLRALSNRYTGPKAIGVRQQAVPAAYRVFFRHVGIDPDERRTPIEQMVLDRMKWGGFRSSSILDDALLIATVETGVPIVAFDADRISGELGLRLSAPGERLGGEGRPLSSRQLLISDAVRSVAVLFGDMAEGRGVHPRTERMILAAVRVKGVPEVSVEEALWTVADILADPRPND
jgi:DNA/RNA-binding domain of Phe-tRNA-synthetase-like protein